MLRHCPFQLAVVPMLLLVLVGCSGSDGESTLDVQPDNTNDSVGDDIIDCPDGLVLYEEHGVCAPYIPECEAWEMPTVEGTCVVIGPRACSKAWDPDADVDCEPGDLMPCKEGFVLTEDEVACIPFFEEDGVCGENEIPILGGGCQRVGPEWGVAGGPFFDECGSGFLATPGGGCQLIGPRACPKLWDPDADVDCEIGDVLPCPKGWIEGEDGLYCEPIYDDDCEPGERPLLGGGCHRVIPLPEDCPIGMFPEVPEDATEVLYVLADSPCTENCGSTESPYPSIQAAVDAVPQGGSVLVGEGTYDEGLAIDKPVHVIGVCASVVELTGKTLVLASKKSKTMEAGVGVVDTHDVEIRNIRVVSPAQGIAIVNVQDFSLSDIDVYGSHGTALYIDHGSSGATERLWLHDTNTGSGQLGNGLGMWLGGGSVVTLRESLIDAVERVGITVVEEDTELDLSETTIQYTRLNFNDDGGIGIQVGTGASICLKDTQLKGNRTIGLYIYGESFATIENSIIQGTKPDHMGQFGFGVEALEGSRVDISNSLLDKNASSGIYARHHGTEILLVNTVARDTKPDEAGTYGRGIEALQGAHVNLTGCLIERNTDTGVGVSDAGTQVSLLNTIVRDTMPNEDSAFGDGLVAFFGGLADVTGCLVEGNTEFGAVAYGIEAKIALVNTTIRNTKPQKNGDDGDGVFAFGGSLVSVAGCLVEDNTGSGAFATGFGTEISFLNTVIRDTKPNKEEEGGLGIVASDGVVADISACLIERNTGTGVSAVGPNTAVKLTNTILRDTKPNVDGLGRGIGIQKGGLLNISGCRVERNSEGGVIVTGAGTFVGLSNTLIRGTAGTEAAEGEFGVGVGVGAEGVAEISGCLIERTTGVGVAVQEIGTEVTLAHTTIRDTQPTMEGLFGVGIDICEGSSVGIFGCLIEKNRLQGIYVNGPVTDVGLSSTIIRDTRPVENGVFGTGIYVSDGSHLEIAGCLVSGNTHYGIMAYFSDTELRITNTIIRNTQSTSQAEYGVGVAVSESKANIDMSMFTGNRTAGIWSVDTGSSIWTANCAVLDTQGGGGWRSGVAGDGVLVSHGGQLDLHSSIVARNDRTGVYYSNSTGSVSGSIITLNESYGLAIDSCETCVDYSDTWNRIVGNALDLTPEWSKEVTTDPGAIPVPEPPDWEIPELPE